MATESIVGIWDFVTTNPVQTDSKKFGDDHIRRMKAGIVYTFVGVTGQVTTTHTELNRLAGISSNVQSQLDAKANAANATLTGTATVVNMNASGTVDFAGITTATTQGLGANNTRLATTEFVQNAIGAVSGSPRRAYLYFTAGF